MTGNDAQFGSVENRERDRQKIAQQVEEFLKRGGQIQTLESHLLNGSIAPMRAATSDIGLF